MTKQAELNNSQFCAAIIRRITRGAILLGNPILDCYRAECSYDNWEEVVLQTNQIRGFESDRKCKTY